MRMIAVLVLSLAPALGACSVVGVVSDAASVAGTVVSTTVDVAGDAVDAASNAVGGTSSNQDKDKKAN